MSRFATSLAFLTIVVSAVIAPPTTCHASSKPNVLIILADDMGYSDAGCYGGEISTPNLDGLAKEGLRFTQFYNTARCWPSRAAIMTGYYAQQVRRDTVPEIISGVRGTRPGWAPLLPELLRKVGYRCYHSGKWHLDGEPLHTGFDRSYRLNDTDRYFSPASHFEDDKPLPPVKPNSGYYSTVAIANHAIKYLKEHAGDHPDQPFFEYVAFTSPHFPLQAPAADIARYQDRYLKGWDVMREQRWQRMHAMGIGGPNLSYVERHLGPPYAFPDLLEQLGPDEVNLPIEWDQLTSWQQEFQSRKMPVHAAMVDRMDHEIGRILDQLRSMKAMDDTLIFFLSDNGASAEMMVRGDGHNPKADFGSADSFICIGPGWSTMCNTPFRRHKTWVHEGGISTPLIVHWPAGFSARGELRHTPGHIIDIVPTILEATGATRSPTWHGKPPPTPPGKSLLPVFAKDGTVTHESLWWLHEENRALRVGDWKIVAAGKDSPWELYDLATDRGETHNLAADDPEKVKELAANWTKQEQAYFELASIDAPRPPATQPAATHPTGTTRPARPGRNTAATEDD